MAAFLLFLAPWQQKTGSYPATDVRHELRSGKRVDSIRLRDLAALPRRRAGLTLDISRRIGLTYPEGSPNYRPGSRRGYFCERARSKVDLNHGKPQSI